MTILLLILIFIVLLMILGNQNKQKKKEYFEENRLPNGDKVSETKWLEIATFSCLGVGLLYGFITKDIAKALGWSFMTLLLVAGFGPYLELEVARFRKNSQI